MNKTAVKYCMNTAIWSFFLWGIWNSQYMCRLLYNKHFFLIIHLVHFLYCFYIVKWYVEVTVIILIKPQLITQSNPFDLWILHKWVAL